MGGMDGRMRDDERGARAESKTRDESLSRRARSNGRSNGRRAMAGGQAGRRAGGQAGRRAGGQAGRRAGGQAGRRADER